MKTPMVSLLIVADVAQIRKIAQKTLLALGILCWIWAVCITPRAIAMLNGFHVDEQYQSFFNGVRIGVPILALVQLIGVVLFHKQRTMLCSAKFTCAFQLLALLLYIIVVMK